MDGTILVADDDRTIRTVLSQALVRAGCKVRATGSLNTLWRWIDEGEGDAVVSDIALPDGDGLDLLPAIRKRRPDLPVIIISAQNTVVTAIKASESGAFDYLPKPFDLKNLLSKVSKSLAYKTTGSTQIQIETTPGQDLPLVGSSAPMQEVYRLLARVINTDLNVLITGESGTGKNLLAESLHNLSQRKNNLFHSIHAPTLQPDEIQELFFRNDDGSLPQNATIFLDEISELSEEAQLALLEVLRSETLKKRDHRFISSSQISPRDLVEDGQFREDLFYRLNVVPINLPPLKERLDDIPELVNHFLRQSAASGSPLKSIDAKGLQILRNFVWPGNIRELENFVSRLVVMANDDEISAKFIEDMLQELSRDQNASGSIAQQNNLSSSVEAHIKRYFDLHGDTLPPPGLYQRILKEVELPLIALSLSATRGNQIKTSELLGINRNTLRKKIQELDIQVTRSKKMM